jgi:hypothetical protein
MIKKLDIKKMGFIARLGHYEYIVMPFELTFIIMTFYMVNCKLSSPHNLPHGKLAVEHHAFMD